MSQGKVVQIIGAVVDIDFPQESVPGIYDALNVTSGDLAGLVLEVQQQIRRRYCTCHRVRFNRRSASWY